MVVIGIEGLASQDGGTGILVAEELGGIHDDHSFR
jgi:glycerate kinase